MLIAATGFLSSKRSFLIVEEEGLLMLILLLYALIGCLFSKLLLPPQNQELLEGVSEAALKCGLVLIMLLLMLLMLLFDCNLLLFVLWGVLKAVNELE